MSVQGLIPEIVYLEHASGKGSRFTAISSGRLSRHVEWSLAHTMRIRISSFQAIELSLSANRMTAKNLKVDRKSSKGS